MTRSVGGLMLSAMLLLASGWFIYHAGTRANQQIANEDQTLWEQGPGDKWLYVGGLMMLISGSLGVAAILVWSSGRKSDGSTLQGWVDR